MMYRKLFRTRLKLESTLMHLNYSSRMYSGDEMYNRKEMERR